MFVFRSLRIESSLTIATEYPGDPSLANPCPHAASCLPRSSFARRRHGANSDDRSRRLRRSTVPWTEDRTRCSIRSSRSTTSRFVSTRESTCYDVSAGRELIPRRQAQAMLSIVGSKETVEKLAQSWEAIDLEAVKSEFSSFASLLLRR